MLIDMILLLELNAHWSQNVSLIRREMRVMLLVCHPAAGSEDAVMYSRPANVRNPDTVPHGLTKGPALSLSLSVCLSLPLSLSLSLSLRQRCVISLRSRASAACQRLNPVEQVLSAALPKVLSVGRRHRNNGSKHSSGIQRAIKMYLTPGAGDCAIYISGTPSCSLMAGLLT